MNFDHASDDTRGNNEQALGILVFEEKFSIE